MSSPEGERPWLVGGGTWSKIRMAIVVLILASVGWLLWEWFDHRRECGRLDRRVVTNQQEADRLFDDRLAAGCL